MYKISIITVCLNNIEGLKRTCESVWGQTAKNDIEHIIIDGGSQDNTVNYLQANENNIDYWVSESDKGIYHAMNKGIDVANGEYCLFLNSGDILSDKTIIHECLSFLDGTDIIYGDIIFQDPNDGKKHFITLPEKISSTFFLNNTLAHPSTFIRTDIIRRHKYDEKYRIASDFLFFAKGCILDGFSIKKIPFFISIYFMDGISINSQELSIKERDSIIKEYFSKTLIDDLSTLNTYQNTPGIRYYIKLINRLIKLKQSIYKTFK